MMARESTISEFCGVLVTGLCFVFLIDCAIAAEGTPEAFKEIFIGRCEDYKLGVVNKDTIDDDELSSKNCSGLWDLFSMAWVDKAPCNVTKEDYDPFVAAGAISIPTDKANFWDGWDIYDTVRSYSQEGRRSWTLDYTLLGYLINGFLFCGDVDNGINYESCPGEMVCGFGMGATDAFWARASTYFATHAEGVGKLFFNSSRPGGAFQEEESFFTEFELSNINPDKVTMIEIYVLTNLDQTPLDDCSSDSIVRLKEILTERSIPYECYENPRDALHQLCIDFVDHKDCTFLTDEGASHKPVVFLPTLLAFVVLLTTISH